MKKIILVLLLIVLLSGCGEDFCGNSTKITCSSNEDCKVGGCSNQICGATEGFMTTCEYRDCYDAKDYNMECKCVDSKCQWS